jgi:hypothetical protein
MNILNYIRNKYLTLWAKTFILFNRVFILAINKEFPFIFVAVIPFKSEPKPIEHNYDGMCPECHEHTTAGDSCCGAGAYVDGGLITDEEAFDDAEHPRLCIKLLIDAPQEYCRKVHSALFNSCISSNFFSGTNAGTEYGEPYEFKGNTYTPGRPKYAGWCINIFIDL